MGLFSGLMRGLRHGERYPSPHASFLDDEGPSALSLIQAAQQARVREMRDFGFGASENADPGALAPQGFGSPVLDDGGIRQSPSPSDGPPDFGRGLDLQSARQFAEDGDADAQDPAARAQFGSGAELGRSLNPYLHLAAQTAALPHVSAPPVRPAPALTPAATGRRAPPGHARRKVEAPAAVAPIVTRPGYEDELKARSANASDYLSGFNYDEAFLDKKEGMKLKGYRPRVGPSGITISTGLDIGQQSSDYIKGLGLPPELTERLLPYTAFGPGRPRIKAAADAALDAKPLAVTEMEAEAISKAVKADFMQRIEKRYDSQSKTRFRNLPKGMQTAILSFAYQHSPEFARRGKTYGRLWNQFISQDWTGAMDTLAWFGIHENGNKFKSRRSGEIGHIRGELPPPPKPVRKVAPNLPHRR